jgi:uncharacterized membrane protein YeaQ/YmgE (transglycosylase-associated protein family)
MLATFPSSLFGPGMNLALWVGIGAFVGLIVGLATRGWTSMLLDALIGIAGAIPLGWFLMPMSSGTDPASIQLAGLVGAFVGASALVAFAEIVRP